MVSGSFTGLDGKKIALKTVTVNGVDGKAPVSVSLSVKGFGTMDVTIGGKEFAGSLGGTYHVQSGNVGGDWTRNDAAVYVDATGELPTGTVADLLPDGEPVIRKSGKWSFAKAAGVKLSKDKSRVEWNTSRGNTNLSGLKLTYIPKRGTFKGSFKVYALEGSGKKTRLRKHTVRVTGLVVDGIGYGKATCKKPSVSWTVTVR